MPFKKPVAQLPDEAKVLRASGRCVCEICGKIFYEHPEYNYPGFTYGPVLGCDGIFYHL